MSNFCHAKETKQLFVAFPWAETSTGSGGFVCVFSAGSACRLTEIGQSRYRFCNIKNWTVSVNVIIIVIIQLYLVPNRPMFDKQSCLHSFRMVL